MFFFCILGFEKWINEWYKNCHSVISIVSVWFFTTMTPNRLSEDNNSSSIYAATHWANLIVTFYTAAMSNSLNDTTYNHPGVIQESNTHQSIHTLLLWRICFPILYPRKSVPQFYPILSSFPTMGECMPQSRGFLPSMSDLLSYFTYEDCAVMEFISNWKFNNLWCLWNDRRFLC